MIAQRQETGWRRAIEDSLLITGRNLIRLRRNPIIIVAIAIFPIVFLAGFWLVGQKLMAAQGVNYIQYLVPIINLQALFFSGLGSSLMFAKDIESGMMNRCRAMPISRVSTIAGLVAAYMVRALLATLILLLVAYVIFGLSVVTRCVDLASTHLKAYFTKIHYLGPARSSGSSGGSPPRCRSPASRWRRRGRGRRRCRN